MIDKLRDYFINPKLKTLVRSYRKQIITLAFFSFLSAVFFLIGPYLSKLFIDQAFIGRDMQEFLRLSFWGIVVFVISTLFKLFADIVKNKISLKVSLNLSEKLIKKFYSLDLAFFQSRTVGENIYRLGNIEAITQFLLEQCPQILADSAKLVIILGVCLWLNWQMTIMLVFLSPLFLIHNIYIQNKLRKIYEELWQQSAELSREIYEAFSRISIIKALGLEGFKKRAYLSGLIKNLRLRVKSFRWGLASSLFSTFASKAVFGILSLYGGWLIIRGRMTIGSYSAVMIYLVQLGGLFESLGYSLRFLAEHTVYLDKFLEVMDTPATITEMAQAVELPALKGEIVFEGVSFGYEKQLPVLREIDFTIPSSSWIAIVGPSGSGKTTLVSLILRLYDPWSGRIVLDGRDLKSLKIKSLREKISIATQQPFLFNVPIRENIAYGKKDAGIKEVEEAARICCIDEFIGQQPGGYESVIGEDAFRLSQGLKQRLTLARAVLRNPELLILDEATASVDSLTEGKIFQRMREKRSGLTTLIVSHRLFSVKDADRIYFLRKDGKIESGDHRGLMESSPQYREFFSNQ
ncbi:MAG: ABC transporter ATP-binding protein [Candidatus Omnitrophica bacterium]|nr:ABC transporter ATP-binding protein [Candidatus Omnitrophota bacterium]